MWFIGHCQSSTGLAVVAGTHRPEFTHRVCILLCVLQGNAESAVRATVEWLLKCNAVVLPQGGVYLILHGLACTTGLLLVLSVLVFMLPHANVTGCNTLSDCYSSPRCAHQPATPSEAVCLYR